MKKKFHKSYLLAAVVGMTVSTSVFSEEQVGFYIGVGGGQSEVDDLASLTVSDAQFVADIIDPGAVITSGTSEKDDTDTGVKLFLGYSFNEYFALEASYIDLGEASTSVTGSGLDSFATPFTGTIEGEFEVDGFALSAVGSYPFTDAFSIFGKAGVFKYETDFKASLSTSLGLSVSVSDDESGTEITYGVGLNYRFNDNFSLRAEWERFPELEAPLEGEDDVDLISASLVIGF